MSIGLPGEESGKKSMCLAIPMEIVAIELFEDIERVYRESMED